MQSARDCAVLGCTLHLRAHAALSPHDRPPRIRYDCFLPSLAAFTWGRFDPGRASLSIASSPRALRLFTRFSPALRAAQVCPSSPGFDLRLPLHVRSRSRSCHRLTVRRVNVRRGLAPPSYRPCRAYNKKPLRIGGAFLIRSEPLRINNPASAEQPA